MNGILPLVSQAGFLATLTDLTVVSVLVRIILSVLAGAVIGYERGRHGRAAGLRTHILISLGGCMAALVGTYMVTVNGFGDVSRIAASVVSGIGFVATGIILVKNNATVTGLTTAAAMWTTGIVGLAFGAGFFVAAFAASLVLYIALTLVVYLEVNQKKDRRFLLEIDNADKVNTVIEKIKDTFTECHNFDILPAKSGVAGRIDISVNLSDDPDTVIQTILAWDGIIFVYEE